MLVKPSDSILSCVNPPLDAGEGARGPLKSLSLRNGSLSLLLLSRFDIHGDAVPLSLPEAKHT